jgi:UDP-GlcNAc:undecaprenyl-phosphate GlcNAc-1-phosphate transferase
MIWNYLILCLIAAATCAAIVPLVKRLAVSLGAVDQPGGRRSHSSPIPRMGGVAIFLAFMLTLGIAWFASGHIQAAHDVNPRGVWAFAGAACLIFTVGIVDDVRALRARTKLLFQIAAAVIVVWLGGCRIGGLTVPGGTLDMGGLGIPLTVFWIVLITNAVNLLDGLDGLAAGVVAIALTAVVAITDLQHASVAIVAVIVIGACIGFLVHNSHPATIFMGDSGSLFLGFSLAVLSTYANAKTATGAVTLPFLIAALPLADTVWAIVRRYVRGLVPVSLRAHAVALKRIFVADRKHIHHRLIDAGLSQRQAVYVLYGIQAVICVAAIYTATQLVAPPGATPAMTAPTLR